MTLRGRTENSKWFVLVGYQPAFAFKVLLHFRCEAAEEDRVLQIETESHSKLETRIPPRGRSLTGDGAEAEHQQKCYRRGAPSRVPRQDGGESRDQDAESDGGRVAQPIDIDGVMTAKGQDNQR